MLVNAGNVIAKIVFEYVLFCQAAILGKACVCARSILSVSAEKTIQNLPIDSFKIWTHDQPLLSSVSPTHPRKKHECEEGFLAIVQSAQWKPPPFS